MNGINEQVLSSKINTLTEFEILVSEMKTDEDITAH